LELPQFSEKKPNKTSPNFRKLKPQAARRTFVWSLSVHFMCFGQCGARPLYDRFQLWWRCTAKL